MDRKARIKDLQIRNKRRLMYDSISNHIEGINIENFIPMNYTLELQKKIFDIMKEMDAKKMSVCKSLDNSCVTLIKQNMDVLEKHYDDKVIFFHYEATEIGAIEFNIADVISKIDYLVSISDMYEYGSRIFLVNKNLKFGLCLWKSEYEFILYKWTE